MNKNNGKRYIQFEDGEHFNQVKDVFTREKFFGDHEAVYQLNRLNDENEDLNKQIEKLDARIYNQAYILEEQQRVIRMIEQEKRDLKVENQRLHSEKLTDTQSTLKLLSKGDLKNLKVGDVLKHKDRSWGAKTWPITHIWGNGYPMSNGTLFMHEDQWYLVSKASNDNQPTPADKSSNTQPSLSLGEKEKEKDGENKAVDEAVKRYENNGK